MVSLAVGWCWLTTRPQHIAVSFVGYQASEPGGREWMAVFQATNGTSTKVSYFARFQPQPNERYVLGRSSESEALAAHSGATWRYAVPDTNSVRRFELLCFERPSALTMRLAMWFAQHPTLDPNHRVTLTLLESDHDYRVTCLTEAH